MSDTPRSRDDPTGDEATPSAVVSTVGTRDRLLQTAAKTLSPDASLERIDAAAQRLVVGLTAAGALISGLGLLTAAELKSVGIGWALPSVLLSAVAVALAVFASTPTSAKVPPGNLPAVHAFFRRQIKIRGGLIRGAAIAFALAIATAPLPAIAEAVGDDEAAIDLTVTAVRGKAPSVAVAGAGLKPDARVDIEVIAGAKLVSEATIDARPDGSVKQALPVPKLLAGTRVIVTAEAGGLKRSATVQVPG